MYGRAIQTFAFCVLAGCSSGLAYDAEFANVYFPKENKTLHVFDLDSDRGNLRFRFCADDVVYDDCPELSACSYETESLAKTFAKVAEPGLRQELDDMLWGGFNSEDSSSFVIEVCAALAATRSTAECPLRPPCGQKASEPIRFTLSEYDRETVDVFKRLFLTKRNPAPRALVSFAASNPSERAKLVVGAMEFANTLPNQVEATRDALYAKIWRDFSPTLAESDIASIFRKQAKRPFAHGQQQATAESSPSFKAPAVVISGITYPLGDAEQIRAARRAVRSYVRTTKAQTGAK